MNGVEGDLVGQPQPHENANLSEGSGVLSDCGQTPRHYAS